MANREMKYSGVEWIGEIPKGWKVTKLRNCLRTPITDGPHETPRYVDEGIPFISVNAINGDGTINRQVANRISESDARIYNNKTNLEVGDILFTKAATIGKIAIVDVVDFMIWSPIAVIKSNKRMYNHFLKYVFMCNGFLSHVSNLGTKNTQINVGMRAMEQSKVPVLSLSEQQKIAAFLDEKTSHIDNIIENTKKSIENLKAYKQSLITETITKGLDPNVEMKNSGIQWIGEIPKHWRVTKVKNFVQIKNGKDNKVKDGEIPVYGSGGVFGKTDQIMYEKASVLLGRKGTIDSPKYIEKPFWAVDTTFYTIAKPNVALKFFYYLMKSIDYKKYTYGSAIPSMSQSILNEIKLPYTNLDEQKQIAIFLDDKTSHVDSLIKQKEQLVAELESYKKSLIYEYVTGKKEVK
ncbi:restriction endonuclease subunit S [Aerococcus urinaeequi]|uniref:restriction endonuclease subunit S n=1 Tax=Aerococcus urinaeequi TaxID=51665 RepID=UPI003D6AF182